MTEEADGGSPRTPKKLKMESEEEVSKDSEESKQIEEPNRFKMESEEEEALEDVDHSQEEEEESKQIEDDDEDEDELPLLDMIHFPSSSTLPPTPPLPSSPADLDMEQQDSDEDDGPPPGWDNRCQLKEQQAEQLVTLAATSAMSSDIQTADARQDACNEEHEPRSEAHPCLPPEVAPSDLDMEQRDSDEDDGPPPGWDNKYQPKEQQVEQLVTLATTSAISSDIQKHDVRQDAHNEELEPQSQAHPFLPPEVAPSVEEQDSEDDGPPPGWDSKCQPEPKLQETPQSDMKMEDVLQDAHNEEGQPTPKVPSGEFCQYHDLLLLSVGNFEYVNYSNPNRFFDIRKLMYESTDIIMDREGFEDEGPPPGWDSKCQPEPILQKRPQSDSSDIKMTQDAHDENDPQSQSQLHSGPAPELIPSDIKMEEQDSEDDGPPPGWNSKCQLGPNLQMACQTTTPSDSKIEEDKEHAPDDEGSPPGWRSTPQQQSHAHSSLPSPVVQSGTGYEPNNVKTIEESPQAPSRQLPIQPIKQQISVPKPPTMNTPEMGQMVCGSCRHLLSYPRGARYVECACCLEENYVLEEHEVGQVVCRYCNVLLMYPYGAPRVRCANCGTETEIGDQNRRPPLSEHKMRARQHLRRVQAG